MVPRQHGQDGRVPPRGKRRQRAMCLRGPGRCRWPWLQVRHREHSHILRVGRESHRERLGRWPGGRRDHRVCAVDFPGYAIAGRNARHFPELCVRASQCLECDVVGRVLPADGVWLAGRHLSELGRGLWRGSERDPRCWRHRLWPMALGDEICRPTFWQQRGDGEAVPRETQRTHWLQCCRNNGVWIRDLQGLLELHIGSFRVNDYKRAEGRAPLGRRQHER
mmetsp:Transcript_5800/g.16373  ORF Transcript_5800/g.16373 Transcript_5800/m.16373 type:complete len:222 (+) Transcript_5800:669-1334(+)